MKTSEGFSPLGNGVCGYGLFEVLSTIAKTAGPYGYIMKQTYNCENEICLASERQLRVFH